MPPLPAIPNVVKARLVGSNQATTWNNVLHLQYSGTAPQVADCQAIGNSVMAAWATNIAPLVNISAALLRVEVVDLTSNTAAEGVSNSTEVIGTRVGTAVSGQIAGVVSWSANVRFRGGHARSYMPLGVVADMINGRSWTDTFQASALAGARGFRTALNAITHGSTTYKLIFVSYRTGNAPRPQPLPFTIQDAQFHGRLDSQRRRLGKETT